jgi:acetamidase/formamidase
MSTARSILFGDFDVGEPMHSFHVPSTSQHLAWDNTLAAAVTVAPGDELTVEIVDASADQIHRDDDASAVSRLDFSRVNPCTGPIYVDGVEPGDELVVTIVEVDAGQWSWTANIPGFGLLSDDFPDAHLWISTIRNGVIATPIGVDCVARPMIGTIGLASAAPGLTPLLVPTNSGGNMDIAQIGAGTTLHLGVQVPGAMLSLGDTHGLQGDGEVCGTGAEMSSLVRLRVDVASNRATPSPWIEYAPSPLDERIVATTGIGPDLFSASREAVRRGIDLVVQRTGLAPIDAYLLLSLVGDLRISEIVNAPHWVVTMHLSTRYL